MEHASDAYLILSCIAMLLVVFLYGEELLSINR